MTTEKDLIDVLIEDSMHFQFDLETEFICFARCDCGCLKQIKFSELRYYQQRGYDLKIIPRTDYRYQGQRLCCCPDNYINKIN